MTGKVTEGTKVMASKVWFITGTSRGFGHIWARAALARGDRVAATARDVGPLQPLVEQYGDRVAAITLDVTDKSAVGRAVAETVARFGRIDVAVNNAGYGLTGMVEEVSEAQARAQIETNLFGALWVTQAVLPHMRAQMSGHIIQVSSIAGITTFPDLGLYSASKWGLEGFSRSLALEVAEFGIKVTIVEPSAFKTNGLGTFVVRATPLPAYDGAREAIARIRGNIPQGDPEATGAALLAVIDAEEPPLAVFFGTPGLLMTRPDYAQRIETWERWDHIALQAQGDLPRDQWAPLL
jgi:NAD(P)-dependent dehydrogenase (short-subunit alcohol dehydrogenase family)